MNINASDIKPFNEVDILGVAITVDDSGNQNHIGLLYKLDLDQSTDLLHLAFHFLLLKTKPSDRYLWLECGLDKINKAAMAAFCQDVYEANGADSIPYGIDLSGKSFDSVTGLWNHKTCTGLTCSTFVMEVFSALGHSILDIDTWKPRESDKEWQANIISTLLSNGASNDHVDYQMKHIGAFRFRPEEVVGSVPQKQYMVSFDDAKSFAKEILDALKKHRTKGN